MLLIKLRRLAAHWRGQFPELPCRPARSGSTTTRACGRLVLCSCGPSGALDRPDARLAGHQPPGPTHVVVIPLAHHRGAAAFAAARSL